MATTTANKQNYVPDFDAATFAPQKSPAGNLWVQRSHEHRRPPQRRSKRQRSQVQLCCRRYNPSYQHLGATRNR